MLKTQVVAFAFAALGAFGFTAALATEYPESAFWQEEVSAGNLPPVAERVPTVPKVVDLTLRNRDVGQQGGTLRTMVTRSKDVRQMVVYGYARLIGYNERYELVPDILEAFENEDDKKFTMHLRPGHKWSDGHPFTSEDFRYWWEDVANNELLSPSGPVDFLRVEGELPKVSFPDAQTVIYEWSKPNPQFLQMLAEARPPFIYRPAHQLKPYHADYTDEETLSDLLYEARVRSWAALHNRLDNMYKFDNPDLATLQPWMLATKDGKSRFLFVRNPFYHRVDTNGVQLPYIDVVEMQVVAPGLVAAKANAGEVDLQARGLDFKDAAILKKGEATGNYETKLWANGTASQIAIYPNLNYHDDMWRETLRDVRFRRALSLAINRKIINRGLYFGLAKEGGMTVLPISPFYKEENRKAWAVRDVAQANALLDEMGLDQRDKDGYRLLPDGRPVWVVVETAGERQEVENALQIIIDNWAELGVKLIMRPLERDILRNRVYSGESMMSTWFGWDNGLPQTYTSPGYLAPWDQAFQSWPMWGQYHQTHGEVGEAPDMDAAIELNDLAHEWTRAFSAVERGAIWQKMVDIHADNVFAIGLLNGAPQPVVVSNRLRNVPEKAIWAWSPGAHFGVHRPDEFFFVE
ncbi:ABC transporter substrate-binding protein [Shimia marina]|uniref:Putative ABC transporter-binding protein n=1 Tax=Shimia marina TaxID=321267 RepID=A0A0P1EMF7_9RHOB|nr:ABC transporter substrate-binding protein [Shimia marina]CUH51248.1 putative ABC transporter-binding protein precursor [Shimia marina]SFD54039.1 peptide/nickel transport system substrate-binding protein [Shimia marina]